MAASSPVGPAYKCTCEQHQESGKLHSHEPNKCCRPCTEHSCELYLAEHGIATYHYWDHMKEMHGIFPPNSPPETPAA